MISDGVAVGRQKVKLIAPDTAFAITALTKNIRMYEKQIYKFIRHTGISRIQWVNFNRHDISFTTISNPSK